MNPSPRTGRLNAIWERRRSRRQRKPGDAPGSLVFEGAKRVDEVLIEVVDYGPEKMTRRTLPEIRSCRKFVEAGNPTWLNITGLHEVEMIAEVGRAFGIPDLLQEDILNTGSRQPS